MNFDGDFEIDDVTVEEVWLALSDPYMIKTALPGCEFLVRVDEEDVDFEQLRTEMTDRAADPPILPEATPEDVAERAFEEGGRYATLLELSVGSVKPSFESVVVITEREFPRMRTSGEGSAASSSFELSAGMELAETDTGVVVEWAAEADVFGRIAQLGGRVINPVANRVVHQFFDDVADRLNEVGDAEATDDRENLRDRVRRLL
ncbi:Carbon monoxide dehydrogenase subunit G [Halogranum amylolyticum]|uniref:Carbon monoxide dehydrogenase subunit G n=1 Tax=Halogranum amylolyticum TaxID=660520 RepID=A0A1H8V226_9EURY|nr:SRPBCC domain-containing protein [Halogranum amylolyticum]SEP08818.1 Carbon monoxide dehydrogenase subunit G [Halogranum amylolyticum]